MNRREAIRTLGAGAAAGALAGGVVIAAEAPATDPMLALAAAYRKGLAAYDADGDLLLTNEACEARALATYSPHYDRLCDDPPTPTTLAGAIAAVRLVHDEEATCGHREDFTVNVLRAALAYFEEHP